MPRVSIVIAAYNPGTFLEETVRSVIAQTYCDWELMIVDDGSPQDISAVQHMHPQIVYIRQNNQGQAAARNAAILQAKGDLIAFLDQDDLWEPTKLQQQVAVMDADETIGLSYTNFERVDANGTRLGDGFVGAAQTYEKLLLGCCICISMTMVRRSALAASGLFDPAYTGVLDYDLWLKIARRHPLKYLPEVLGSYRQHAGGFSARYAVLFKEMRMLFHEHIELAQRNHQPEALRAACKGLRRARLIYGSQAFDFCRTAFRGHEYKPLVSHLIKASRLAPMFVLQSAWHHVVHSVRRHPNAVVTHAGTQAFH